MSLRCKRELLVQVAPRYSSARHGQRSVILDEFVAVTGYERNTPSARCLIRFVHPRCSDNHGALMVEVAKRVSDRRMLECGHNRGGATGEMAAGAMMAQCLSSPRTLSLWSTRCALSCAASVR